MSKPKGRPGGRPKGSPATPATRKGRGAGLHGPAKGAGNKVPFSADDQHRGARTTETIQAKIADDVEVLTYWTDVLRAPGEATINRMAAGEKIVNRRYGNPVQRNENTTIRTVIRAPAAPKDFAEWQAQHSPNLATKPN